MAKLFSISTVSEKTRTAQREKSGLSHWCIPVIHVYIYTYIHIYIGGIFYITVHSGLNLFPTPRCFTNIPITTPIAAVQKIYPGRIIRNGHSPTDTIFRSGVTVMKRSLPLAKGNGIILRCQNAYRELYQFLLK